MMRLHVFPPSPRALKVLAVARHLELDFELCIVDLFKGENQTPEYARLNPNRRMPVLEDGDFVLWESNAIQQYLAAKKPESGLWPGDARGQADVARWQHWESAHMTPAAVPIVFQRVVKQLAQLGPTDEAEVAKALPGFEACAAVLNDRLQGRHWLVGERLTIADFCIGACFAFADAASLPLARWPEIGRWYTELRTFPGWQKSLVPPMS
jgi:glutathione S-transferase